MWFNNKDEAKSIPFAAGSCEKAFWWSVTCDWDVDGHWWGLDVLEDSNRLLIGVCEEANHRAVFINWGLSLVWACVDSNTASVGVGSGITSCSVMASGIPSSSEVAGSHAIIASVSSVVMSHLFQLIIRNWLQTSLYSPPMGILIKQGIMNTLHSICLFAKW